MKRKTRRFDEGGDTTAEFKRPFKSTDDAKSETAAAPKKVSFNTAFAAARRAGDKTFEWEGKKYGTAMKGESKSSQGKISTTGVDAGIAAAEAQKEARNPNSPRLSSMLNVRNMADEKRYAAELKNYNASKAEQKRVADLQSTSTGRALTGVQAPRITQSMKANQADAAAAVKEFDKRSSMARDAYKAQGYADEDLAGMKKGGKVKKMAGGGMTKSASARADGIAIRGKTRA
jgi:hypothetical protein